MLNVPNGKKRERRGGRGLVYDEWRMEISDDIAYTELERGMMKWRDGG